MALFVVTYDLVKENSSFDYQALWDEFEKLNGVKCLLSVYLIDLNNTAAEVSAHFENFIDKNDRLMVIEFDKRPKYLRALKGTNDWVSARFF